MKFKIFRLQELIYKKVIYTIVTLSTVICIFIYLENRNSDEMAYVLSIFYALFLFIIGLYMNNISAQIQNMFYRRKEQYKSLKSLSEIYKPTTKEKEDILSFVIMTQALTGRTSEDINPYIKFNGFNYTESYLRLEKSFLKQREELNGLLLDDLNNYISINNLKKKVVNILILDMKKFFDDVDTWTEETLDLTEEETIQFLGFINNFRKENKVRFKNLDKRIYKIRKMMNKTSRKCLDNMIRIEKEYGDRLFESLNEENELYNNFVVIEKLIKELGNEVLLQDEFVEYTDEYYKNIKEYLENIDTQLQSIKEEVEVISGSYSDF